MIDRRTLLITICLASGCSGRSIKVDNPVVGPAPPRVTEAEAELLATRDGRKPRAQSPDPASDAGSLAQVAFNGEGDVKSPPATPPDLGEVAARVNGTPILTSEILERYGPKLIEAERQLPQDQYQKIRRELIRRDLPTHIEQAVIVDAATAKLGQEQIGKIEEQLDHYFEKEVERMRQQTKAGSVLELEAQMQQAGTSLGSMRRAFGKKQMAAQYVNMKIGEDFSVSRAELLADYESHIADYERPAEVKWQQILISFRDAEGRQQAEATMNDIQRALAAGADFGDLARKHSNGPTAATGGHWDWTKPGSLANPDIAAAVQQLGEGQVSDVLVGDKSLQIIKVTGHKPARVIPFSEVQEEIRTRLQQDKRKQAAETMVAELKSAAVIETMFDEEGAVEGTDAPPVDGSAGLAD